MSCPCCQGSSDLVFHTKDFNRKCDSKTFDYYKCSSCSTIYLHPQPENLGFYYPSEYYVAPKSIEEFENSIRNQKYKIDILKRFVSGGRLLEIGPMMGGFAHLAKKESFDVEVMEISESCCKFISDFLKIKAIHSGNIEQDMPKDRRYNAIALWHVLEHLPSPVRALTKLVEHLEPGGVIILAAPNPDSLQFRMLKKYWAHVDAPRHTQLIPVKQLISQMNSLNCDLVFQTTKDEETLRCNYFGWKGSISIFARLQRNFLIRNGLRVLARAVPWIFSLVEKKEGLGSAYTLVFSKRR